MGEEFPLLPAIPFESLKLNWPEAQGPGRTKVPSSPRASAGIQSTRSHIKAACDLRLNQSFVTLCGPENAAIESSGPLFGRASFSLAPEAQ